MTAALGLPDRHRLNITALEGLCKRYGEQAEDALADIPPNYAFASSPNY